MIKKTIVLVLMAALVGSPFSYAGNVCADFFRAKARAIKAYVVDVKDTRGARIFFVDPPAVTEAQSWRHPFRFLGEYLIDRPTEAITERLFYVKKRPSLILTTVILSTALYFGHQRPVEQKFNQETEQIVAENSLKHEKEDLELLQNDLMYEGIKANLDMGSITKTAALKGVYALRLALMGYAGQAKDLDMKSSNPHIVSDFKDSILFRQANETAAKYNLSEQDTFEVFRLTHRYYFDYINLEIAVEMPEMLGKVEPSLMTNVYRQKVLAAYKSNRMDRAAFRYLIEKDIELTYQYESNSLVEKAKGVKLNPAKALESIRRGVIHDLDL